MNQLGFLGFNDAPLPLHGSISSFNTLNILVGVDFTASNEWKGRKTFNSQSLHKLISNRIHNPYQKVITNLVYWMNRLIVDGYPVLSSDSYYCSNLRNFLRISALGFGDASSVFSLLGTDTDTTMVSHHATLDTLEQIITCYNNAAKTIDLCGPTSFAPIIYKSLDIIKQNPNEMSILFLITDGELTDEFKFETMQAIIDASSYPLSIVIIGVGDGPWQNMQKLTRNLFSKCKFDNLNFVDYHQLCKNNNSKAVDFDFGLKAFMKLPQQLRILKNLNYI